MELTWTKEPPAVPGWYWTKPPEDMCRRWDLPLSGIVEVRRKWDGAPLEFRYGKLDWSAWEKGQWEFAGPIPEPSAPHTMNKPIEVPSAITYPSVVSAELADGSRADVYITDLSFAENGKVYARRVNSVEYVQLKMELDAASIQRMRKCNRETWIPPEIAISGSIRDLQLPELNASESPALT